MEIRTVYPRVIYDDILDIRSDRVIISGSVQRETQGELMSHHKLFGPTDTMQTIQQMVRLGRHRRIDRQGIGVVLRIRTNSG